MLHLVSLCHVRVEQLEKLREQTYILVSKGLFFANVLGIDPGIARMRAIFASLFLCLPTPPF
jgi:hypothetical protein